MRGHAAVAQVDPALKIQGWRPTVAKSQGSGRVRRPWGRWLDLYQDAPMGGRKWLDLYPADGVPGDVR